MRVLRRAALAVGMAAGLAAPAGAAQLVMPSPQPESYQAYSSQAIQHPWDSQTPKAQLVEKPVGEIIAARLGFAEGSAELFRYHLENAPSSRTQLDGLVDGGGIKLKLS